MSNQVYDIIADRILSMLDQGVVPWRKPWVGGSASLPFNGISKKAYRGVNPFMLHAAGYNNPRWFTFHQAKEIGAPVRKGEKGFPVVFWKLNTPKTEAAGGDLFTVETEEKTRKIPLLRYYTVFNAEQLDNLPEKYAEKPAGSVEHDPISSASAIVNNMPHKPAISYAGARAFYRTSDDSVTVPPLESFPIAEEHYSTLFHELAHSTGHESRLNRKQKKIVAFGSLDYGQEELVAEFAASFLCGVAGIETATIENSAAYISNWKATIKADKPLVVMAAAQAQKASDFILNVSHNELLKQRATHKGVAEGKKAVVLAPA